MTNTQLFAKRELDILKENVPDATLIPFTEEILELCEAFGKSGQSGGSAPYTAHVIATSIEKLLLMNPISDVTGREDEWIEVGDGMHQNSRCSGLFKYDVTGKCKYIDAIVWKGEEEYDAFTGSVYVDDVDFKPISSMQFVKFPFAPKTFYIDVVYRPITKEEVELRDIHYFEDETGCYYVVIRDPTQLDEVFEYYERA